MKKQIEKLKLPPVVLVASLTAIDQHHKAIAELMAPQGRFGLIDTPVKSAVGRVQGQVDLDPLGIDDHPLRVPDA